MLVGYIYGPRLLSSTRPTLTRIWKRAALLYGLAVGFTLLYSLWLHFLPGYPRLQSVPQDTWSLIANTITLQYSYGWADFLDRYAVFMLFAPGILWLVVKGRWYIAAGLSGLLWLYAQFQTSFLPYSAWQLLFVAGIIIGYYLPKIEGVVQSLSKHRRQLLLRGVVLSGILSYTGVVVWLYAMQFAHVISPPDMLWIFHDLNTIYKFIVGSLPRETLGIGRLLIGTLWFITLFILTRRYETQIDRATRGLITLLGKNSLFVYSMHAFLIFLIDAIILPPTTPNLMVNTIFGIVFVATLILLTYFKERLSRYNKARQL